MKEINLRELYPDTYNTDTFVEVADEVWAAISSSQRAEAAYERRKFRHKAHYSLDYGNGIEKAAHQAVPTPEELLEEKQQRELLYAAVMSLPEKYRTVLDLFYYEELSVREIAGLLHIEVSAVTTRLSRARAKLKEQLGEVWQDEE